MKSKSLDLKRDSSMGKSKKPFDFISLYKSVAETNNVIEKYKAEGRLDKENSYSESKNEPKLENLPKTKKKKKLNEPLDISQINIEGPNLDSLNRISSLNESKVTSTPRSSNDHKNQVKSIMKNSSNMNDSTIDVEESKILSNNKSKKRNKSVSFMLDDNEEVAKKKTKSEDSLINEKQSGKLKHKKKSLCKFQNIKKPKVLEVEKAVVGDIVSSEIVGESSSKNNASSNQIANPDKKKKDKKRKKQNTPLEMDIVASAPDHTNASQNKKKLNKKNHKVKVSQSTEPTDDEEPAAKSRKTDVKPEVITQNLENLRIGDNAHTLTSLLDEMTVVDKNKKKKTKRKHKKNKGFTSISSTENGDVENVGKEKVKWRRKWNKDKKGEVNDNTMTSVIVENLPLSLMCVYKTVLSEHFAKYGLIKKVGVAEMYPGDSNMTFTTTINFYSDGAATQALEEDGVKLGGSRIRVKRPLPPTQTTAVVRSYASLSDQAICTAFSSAGKIRNIRHLIKGKKSVGDTVFIEFDGPEAVQRALALGNGAKMAGKKVHVAKFEIRKKNYRPKATAETGNEGDSEGEGDTDNSDD